MPTVDHQARRTIESATPELSGHGSAAKTPGLKGPNMIAQGQERSDAALGYAAIKIPHPERVQRCAQWVDIATGRTPTGCKSNGCDYPGLRSLRELALGCPVLALQANDKRSNDLTVTSKCMRLLILTLIVLLAAPVLLSAQEKPEGKQAAKKQTAKKKDAEKESSPNGKKPASNGKKPTDPKPEPKKSDAKSDSDIIAISPEREAAVHAFVEANHPELAEVLSQLKSDKNLKQYQKALRELASVSDKLANYRKSDQDRYELELRAWKLKSRSQLLSARLTMGDNEELKQQLRQVLAEQYDVRRELLSMEKHRLHDRLQKIEKDLLEYDARRESAIERQFQQLTAVATPKTRPATGRSKNDKPAKTTVAP